MVTETLTDTATRSNTSDGEACAPDTGGAGGLGHAPANTPRTFPKVEASRLGGPAVAVTATAIRNHRMMRLLDRIAVRFNEAGVAVMALKGAALNLTIYDRPDERIMADLDLMIRARDVDRAIELLEELGGLRGEPLVRADFFPRFHYELELSIGRIYPTKIDLHVRPFRPLRYAQVVPTDAFWTAARPVSSGHGQVLIPSVEEMLIHLLVHAAVHGAKQGKWLEDIRRWTESHSSCMDWDRFGAITQRWRLSWPVKMAVELAENRFGPMFPANVMSPLRRVRPCWQDRLALWQAPRDAEHSFAHVAVNVLCTPGWRFKLSYLRATMLPDRAHMADGYPRRHSGWLLCAHVLRMLGPLMKIVPSKWRWYRNIETRRSHIHGVGVFATRNFRPGECIARYHGKAVKRHGMYVIPHMTRNGRTRLYELTGKLKYVNHSCNANAKLADFKLVAQRRIEAGQEITIDYSQGTCDCREREVGRVATDRFDARKRRSVEPADAGRPL